jgi:hypothetical protein
MSADTKTPNAIVKALGLTGAMTQAVACGPCLDVGGNTGLADTSDTGDEDEGTSGAAATADAATRRVLSRGVLPVDVADAIGGRLRDRAGVEGE